MLDRAISQREGTLLIIVEDAGLKVRTPDPELRFSKAQKGVLN